MHRMRTFGTATNLMPSVVSIVSLLFSFPFRYGLTRLFFIIDSLELGPGSILGSSGASATTASSSAVPMALFNLSRRGSSNIGSGTFGLVVVGCAIPPLVGLAVLFCYLRRRSLAKAAVSADVCASRPQQPQSDEVVLPPITMRIYVRDFVPGIALACPNTVYHVLHNSLLPGPG